MLGNLIYRLLYTHYLTASIQYKRRRFNTLRQCTCSIRNGTDLDGQDCCHLVNVILQVAPAPFYIRSLS